MILNVSLFLLGLVVLAVGAEVLIRGSVRVAAALGVSSFVIGFTVIGYGTSAPELVVSVSAVLEGTSDIALGNIVGSNIANIGLVLGLAALVRPLTARMRLLWVEVPLVIGVSLVFWFLCGDNRLGRADGVVLLVGFGLLCGYMYRAARREAAEVKQEMEQEVEQLAVVRLPVGLAVLMILLGLVGLLGGAQLMIRSAVEIARTLGVSEWLIGVTIVAVGTSLPEIAAAVAAAYRGESDLVLGNVVGSNLFNILLVLGVTVTVQPIRLSDPVVMSDIPVMVAFSLMLLAMLGNGLVVHRWEGAILFSAYTAFVVWQAA